jgi:hypothetical protein
MAQPEKVAARLAVQVVVTVVQFHHPRARILGRAIEVALTQLREEERERPEWRRIASAFHVFARELNHHMKEQEHVVLDSVQFLMVRERLVFGALSDVRSSFEALMLEHDKHWVLRRRLEVELTTPTTGHESESALALRGLLRKYMTAFTEHHDFEQFALVPTLQPFLHHS